MIYWNRTYKGKKINSSRKVVKSANDYGWVVENDEASDALDMFVDVYGEEEALEALSKAMGKAELDDILDYLARTYDITEEVEDVDTWDKFDLMKEIFGTEELLNNISGSIGTESLAENLAFIFRQYDFREWKNDEIDSSKKSIKSVNEHPGYMKITDKNELKKQLDAGVTVYAKSTGPFGEDEGAAVIAFGDISDADIAGQIVLDDETYEEYGESSAYINDWAGTEVIVLDQTIGQNSSNYYMLDGSNDISDFDLYVSDDEFVTSSKKIRSFKGSSKNNSTLNFYKNLVKSVLSNRVSEDFAIRSIAQRNDCGTGYAKNIFNNYMNRYKDELIKSDAEILDIQKDFNVDGDLNSWAEDYMPGSGKANTKGGELVRAAQRILTEYYNNGNMIGRGYGNETVNPAARYIVEKTSFEGNDEIKDMLNHVVQMDDNEYNSWLKRFEKDFEDWLRGNEQLFAEANDDDIADYSEDDDRAFILNEFYIEDSGGNQYFFKNQNDEFVCDVVQFANPPIYNEEDIFEDGDELSSDIDKTEDYGLVEKDGVSYDWEASGTKDDNGNYSEWKIVRVSIADQDFEVGDVFNVEDAENYSIFDINGNELKSDDLMKI